MQFKKKSCWFGKTNTTKLTDGAIHKGLDF